MSGLKKIILIITILVSLASYSQDNPYEINRYPFIKYELNSYTIYDTLAYNILFNKLTTIAFKGKGKVSIVHIGDSHLQADFLSGNFRKKLQTFFVGAVGGRGFIFPYKVAQTNNPINYKVKSSGQWSNCKSVEKKALCNLGLSGIAVNTIDTTANITISIDDSKMEGYDFDRLMVFHEFGDNCFEPIIVHKSLINTKPYPDKGYTLFEFSDNVTKATIGVSRTDTMQDVFTLYGLNFDSSDSGIIYHTIGVNGAKFESYLKCKYFSSHLSALNPDLVIVSLGTNDSYTNAFDSVKFATNVDKTIKSIKKSTPQTAILFTTPGDNRIKKVTPNKNIATASRIIKRKMVEYKLSYWDFYSIMGGFYSVDYWYYEGLSHTDYLHYSRKGYEYKAQLMFNAFLKAYDTYLESNFLHE